MKITASRRSQFVQTVCKCQKTNYVRAKGLIKCKIENGKLKIMVGKQVCNVKNILCPSVTLHTIARIARKFEYTIFIISKHMRMDIKIHQCGRIISATTNNQNLCYWFLKNQQQSILTGTSKYKKLFCKKRNKNIYPALNFLCKTLYKSVFKW